ncbi:MAG: hypothetical protein H6835_03355 [Planctomycetes bacterium]|nr:hypothetical protein [Planctomycetota bacterium]
MTRHVIPALALTATAVLCAHLWFLELLAARRRRAAAGHTDEIVLRPLAVALAFLVAMTGLFLVVMTAVDAQEGPYAGLSGAIACIVLVPLLLLAEAFAVIDRLRFGGTIRRSIAVLSAGLLFAVGSCFAQL